MQDYASLYAQSVDDVESFWLDAAQHIAWDTPPETGLDRSEPPFYRWFPDGRLNTCFNAVDRHVLAGLGDKNAIIYDSPITGAKSKITFAELQQTGHPAATRRNGQCAHSTPKPPESFWQRGQPACTEFPPPPS